MFQGSVGVFLELRSPNIFGKVPKMEGSSSYKLYVHKAYGYGSFPTPKIAENKVTRKPSILGT